MSDLNVNWNELPEWAEWAAQDKNGYIYVFEEKPKNEGRSSTWGALGRIFCIDKTLQETLNWRDKLTQRPQNSVSVDPEVLKALNRRIADLEAQVEALTPKPEMETVKVYFFKDEMGHIHVTEYPNTLVSGFIKYAIKEVTVTKGEGL